MDQQMIEKLKEIKATLSPIVSNILGQNPCPLYAILKMVDSGQAVYLAGNSEGLAYLASVLLSLAIEQHDGQHVHLTEGEVLDECEKELILAFQKADWDVR